MDLDERDKKRARVDPPAEEAPAIDEAPAAEEAPTIDEAPAAEEAPIYLPRVPQVHVSLRAEGGLLVAELRVEERPGGAMARVLQIQLDHAVVAKTRTHPERPLRFEKALTSLDQGQHRAEFLVHFTGGHLHHEVRTFRYRGPTVRAEGERECHALHSHGSGMTVQRRPVVWRLDDAHGLPARVVLRAVRTAALYLQLCVSASSSAGASPAFAAPEIMANGECALTLRDQRYFVVGSYSASDIPYDLFVERLPESEPSPQQRLWMQTVPPRVPSAYAVVVGISNYRHISSLSWCDEDATEWSKYLARGGYELRVFGDGVSSYAPFVPTAVATEANVRRYIQALKDVLRPGDLFVFATSGHGSGDGRGNSWLCMVDEHGAPEGEYTDKEFSDDLSGVARTGCKVVVCIDHCFSGGFVDDMERTFLPHHDQYFIATTCGIAGYGFDNPQAQHGDFTNCFLVRGLEMRYEGQNPPLGDVFDYAVSIYPHHEAKNRPMCAGNRALTIF